MAQKIEIISKLSPLLESPHTHNVIQGGRGGSKTRGVASIIVDVISENPLNVICAREIQKSLKESSFQVIEQEIYRQGKGQDFNIVKSQGLIESRSGGKIVFIGLQQHTVDSIKSYEGFHWVWIEEAQSVCKASLDILIPTLRTDGWFEHKGFHLPLRMFLYTLNPYSWDDPVNLVLPETREDTQYIHVNYYDNPWFPASLEQERQEAKNTMSPEEYLRIWEGIPFNDGERSVCTRKAVSESMERKVSKDGGIVVGADIARFGADRTVFIKRQGLQMVDMMLLHQKDTQEVARRLADFAEGGKIMVDDTGVGGGVTDKLRDLGAYVVPINFGGRPKKKKKYPDIISEMWFELSDQLDSIGLKNNPELLAELTSRNFKYTNDERRKVESKEEFKKRTGRKSPDLADALILCYYNRGGRVDASAGRVF